MYYHGIRQNMLNWSFTLLTSSDRIIFYDVFFFSISHHFQLKKRHHHLLRRLLHLLRFRVLLFRFYSSSFLFSLPELSISDEKISSTLSIIFSTTFRYFLSLGFIFASDICMVGILGFNKISDVLAAYAIHISGTCFKSVLGHNFCNIQVMYVVSSVEFIG